MAQVRKSITITEQQDAWLKRQVESGNYASDSEVIRDLIRSRQSVEPSFDEALEEFMDTHANTMRKLAQ